MIESDSFHVINIELERIATNINDNEQNSQSQHSFEIILNFKSRWYNKQRNNWQNHEKNI